LGVDRGARAGQRITIHGGVHNGHSATIYRVVDSHYQQRSACGAWKRNNRPVKVGDIMARLDSGKNVLVRDGAVV
jgi:hypothetical protein